MRTHVQIFLNPLQRSGTAEPPLFGASGRPQQVISLAGFAALPQLEDVDGDGFPDFAVATFRPDLIDSIRTRSTKTIDLGFHMFLNKKGKFSTRADLNGKLTLRARNFNATRGFLLARFFIDVTGDGMKDLLVQDSPSTLRIFAPRKARRGLTLQRDPVWSMRWDGFGSLRRGRSQKGGPQELMILLPQQVLHVRFP